MTNQYGLSTEQALHKLHKNIDEELQIFVRSKKKRWFVVVCDMFASDFIPFTWYGLTVIVLEIILLVVSSAGSDNVR